MDLLSTTPELRASAGLDIPVVNMLVPPVPAFFGHINGILETVAPLTDTPCNFGNKPFYRFYAANRPC